MLSVPETPPKGHRRALGALGEDKPPDSGEGLGKGGHASEAQVIHFLLFTLNREHIAVSNVFPSTTNEGKDGMELTLCPVYSFDLLQAERILYAEVRLDPVTVAHIEHLLFA